MTRQTAAVLVLLSILVVAGAVVSWPWLTDVRPKPLEPAWSAVVTTLAGAGINGRRDGKAYDARFSDPFGIAVAPDGSIVVADAGDSHAIRRISTDGLVETVAGGVRGFADGIRTDARFDTPSGVAMDAAGTMYVADTGNDAIRRISTDGHVSTVAGPEAGLRGPIGVAVDATGRVLVADTYNDRIVAIRPDGTFETLAGTGSPGFEDGPAGSATFDTPTGIGVDADGQILVADLGNGAIRAVLPEGDVRTVAPGFGEAPLRPTGVAPGSDGSWFVSDDRGRIIEIPRTGGMRTIAGSGHGFVEGEGSAARFRSPSGVAVVSPGHLVVTDRRNAVVRRIIARSRSTAGPPPPPLTPAFDRASLSRVPLLWPFAPYEGPFEVTGTLGEPRGGVGSERFHAGLDVHAPEGTDVRLIRSDIVDHPAAVSETGSLNEAVRIGAITYVHLRVGRDRYDRAIGDTRFVTTADERGRVSRVRIPRGSRFETGEVIGTVNRFYHAHLNVGWPGEELNPLEFRLLNFEDTVPPTIRRGGIQLYDLDGQPLRLRIKGRLVVDRPSRIVVDAWDQVDGNEPRRRLGLYRLGFGILNPDGREVEGQGVRETIRFDRQPAHAAAARVVYASGSGIPVYGSRTTRFLYVVTSTLQNGIAADGVFDPSAIPAGNYTVRILAADIRGNEAVVNRDLPITIPLSGSLGER